MAMPSTGVKHYFEFDSFRLDSGRHLLLRDGEAVPLAPRTFRLLLALFQHRGTVLSKDELMKQLWPDTVVEENNLTVIISALRKALGENPHQHRYIVTIPGRGYSFVADVREVSDDSGDVGLESPIQSGQHLRESREQREEDRSGGGEVKPLLVADIPALSRHVRPKGAVLVVGVLLFGLALALFYVWFAGRSNQTEIARAARSIAVLPFKTLKGEGSDEYLGLGMADALISKLSNLHQVVIRPTSAVVKYAGAGQDPLAAGRELGVDSLLDGMIQRSDNRIRVTVQLVRVSDGAPLWSEKFDEKFTDIFALQDTIAAQVTEALMLKLSGEEKKQLTKRQTVDPEAYQLYLRGRYFWNKRTAEGLKKGIEYFEQATEKDPSYALAYAGLADCYNLLSYYSVLPPKDSFPKAKAAALKALEFDSHLAEAHTSLALARMVYDRDWAGTESSYQRAIELSPNYATAHQWHAEYLAAMGRSEEAIQEIKRAQELDPLSLIINAAAGFVNYYARRYDQAIEQLQKMQELDPNFWPAHWFLGWSYLSQRRYEEAIDEFKQAKALSGESTGMRIELAHAYAVSGQRGEAQRIIGELMEQSKQSYVSPYGIAMIYVGLGEKDEAFTWLRKAYQERTWDLVYLKVDPKLDSLRTDPRLTDLLRQLNLSPQ
jgi:DNA-binding winged helix-turn-helix (wHTH) protein/TolB-like protein/Tfp pilus assembly protein PilF